MKFKQIFRWVPILFLILIGCQKDLEIEEFQVTEDFIAEKTLSLSQLKNSVKVGDQLQKINLNESISEYPYLKNTTSGIVIDTTHIKMMNYAQTHTYTFRIKRDQPLYFIENIVLHFNVDTQSYDEYLVQYDISADDYVKITRGLLHQVDPDVVITALDQGTFVNASKSSICVPLCTTIVVPCSSSDEHLPGDQECCAVSGDCGITAAYVYQSCNTVCFNVPDPDLSNDIDTNGGGSRPRQPDDDDVLTNPNNYPPCMDESQSINAVSINGCHDLGENESLDPPTPSDPAECAKINAVAKSTSPANTQFMTELLRYHNNDLNGNV